MIFQACSGRRSPSLAFGWTAKNCNSPLLPAHQPVPKISDLYQDDHRSDLGVHDRNILCDILLLPPDQAALGSYRGGMVHSVAVHYTFGPDHQYRS